MTGLDVMSMTWREVHLAWQGRVDHDWTRTAELMAMVANIRQRAKGDTRNYKGADFYRPQQGGSDRTRCAGGTRLTKGLLHALKPLFAKGDACKSR